MKRLEDMMLTGEEREKMIQKYELTEKVKERELLVRELRSKRNLVSELAIKEGKLNPTDLTKADDPLSIQADIAAEQTLAASKLEFINASLSKLVFLAPHQMVLIGAMTGKGKSTCVANIVSSLIKQQKRTLIISNEEKGTDVYARIACLNLGLSFYEYKRSLLNPQDQLALNAEVAALTNHIRVIDLGYKNRPQLVTSVNGLRLILEKVAPDYDAVVLDYFQKINSDTESPDRSINDVQNEAAYILDSFKNTFNGPVIVFSQMWPKQAQTRADFGDRLKGRKTIFDVSTAALELISDKKDFKTQFVCHKDRFFGNDGLKVVMGYHRDHCTYVPNPDTDLNFKNLVAGWNLDRLKSGLTAVEEITL